MYTQLHLECHVHILFMRWVDDLFVCTNCFVNSIDMEKAAVSWNELFEKQACAVYTDVGFKMKVECSEVFIGMSTSFKRDGQIQLKPHFAEQTAESKRYHHVSANTTRRRLISVLAGQICGTLNRTVNDNAKPVLIQLLKTYQACGYNLEHCTQGAEQVWQKHRYTKPLLQRVLTEI